LRCTGLWALVGVVATVSCARSKPPETAVKPTAEPLVAQLLTSFVVQACPDARKMNSRAAETALRQLISPCDKVPGGDAHFSATLMPGGRIELGSSSGDANDGTVPICVLKHTLTHPVALERPCTFDVRLEASHMPRPSRKLERSSAN
jgi:hypothetical protein